MFCYEIVYINNFGSLPAVQYRYPCRVIKIRVSGDNYTSFNSVADPYPGSDAFLTPGWVKNPDPGRTIRIIFPRAWKSFFGLKLKYLYYLMRIRDGKNSDLGTGINIPDPQH
jgi:hypothetical protein